jgi:UDP-glucose 4-epimerase
MKDKTIVTGACNYIGSHIAIKLLKNNYKVVLLDDLSNSAEETLHRIEKIPGIKPSFVTIGLEDETATKNIFKKYKNAKAFLHFTSQTAGEPVQNH